MAAGRSDTQRSLHKMTGQICPRCRHHVQEERGPKLLRCPKHAEPIVLVEPRALALADGDPFLGMVVGGRFAVFELLGAGSMGTVYRARQEAMRRDVALKIVRSDRLVDAQARGRFEQEAHATSLLTSPYTVTVFDFGQVEVEGDDPHFIGGSMFLAMELLDGVSLGDKLKKEGRVAVADALRIVEHSLASLAEAHDKGVIHRDLKPDNLLLTISPVGDKMCKVLDFGIAKLLTPDGGMDALETQAGTVFGTPRYMSPEQAQGKKLDPRSDLYSLGVILYHMLAGRPPFTDGDAVVVMAHHIKTVPKSPSEAIEDLSLPPQLEALLMRVLDKNPDKRPQSARAFRGELGGLSLEPVAASGDLTAVVGGPPSGRGPSRRLMFAAGALVVAGVAAMMLALGGEAAPTQSGVANGLAERAERAAFAAQQQQAVRLADARRRQQDEQAAAGASSTASATVSSSAPRTVPNTLPSKRGYERFDR